MATSAPKLLLNLPHTIRKCPLQVLDGTGLDWLLSGGRPVRPVYNQTKAPRRVQGWGEGGCNQKHAFALAICRAARPPHPDPLPGSGARGEGCVPASQAASTVASACSSGISGNMLPSGAAPKPSGPARSASLILMNPP